MSSSLGIVDSSEKVAIFIDGSNFYHALKRRFKKAQLISGDGDFAPAVEAVKKLGKHVELGHVAGQPCNRLLDACDVEITIDDKILKKCWM